MRSQKPHNGSFKSRGIGHYIQRRAAENGSSSKIHFYAASGGNAGIACVHAARTLGHQATVVIPRSGKLTMVTKLYSMGATEVIRHGATIAEAQEYIHQVLLRDDPHGIFVPPFDHPDIWEGNATVMREIADQLDGKPDVVICSVGGGGLMNGIVQAIEEKDWSDDVQVVATETEGADSLNLSLQAGHRITLPRITSQATSLGVVKVSEQTFIYAQRPNVTSIVLSDAEAARGCCLLAEHERILAELTVGVNVPLCYEGSLQRILGSRKELDRSSRVVIVVCGGNDISIDMLVAWRTAMTQSVTAETDLLLQQQQQQQGPMIEHTIRTEQTKVSA